MKCIVGHVGNQADEDAIGESSNHDQNQFIIINYLNVTPGELSSRLIWSNNQPAADSEVIKAVACVWASHRETN